jgi:hypothetical protein
MHNERLANPKDPHTRALKQLTSIRKKTEELVDQIAATEWRGGIYESNGRVVVPGDNILACIKEGARKRKLGKQAQAGVFALAPSFELVYDGPKDIEELAKDPRFFDYRSVGVNNARVMRARPRFDKWEVTATLAVDEDLLSAEEFHQACETAGLQIGLMEKRPQLGRFILG